MRRALFIASLLGALACEQASESEPFALHADGEWLRDQDGRVTILRGVNYAGLEFGAFIGETLGPEESDFEQIAGWGANVIRLPIAWAYLERQSGILDDAYLEDQVDRVVAWAGDHGMVVVLTMHQYKWSEWFTGGVGAPAWACEGLGYTDDDLGAMQAGCDFWRDQRAPDGATLKDHFSSVWSMVAAHYADNEHVVGLDLFNEPPNINCIRGGVFERDYLFPYYRRLAEVVRAAGARQTLFIEPSILRGAGEAFAVDDMNDDDIAYAPHLYTSELLSIPGNGYSGDVELVAADYAQAMSEADKLGGPLWVGELGGDTSPDFRDATASFVRDSFDQLDLHLAGGAVWAFFPTENVFSLVDATGAEKGDLVAALRRPYARRVAGTPTAMSYDSVTRRFELAWDGSGGETEVWVGNYGGEFSVTVSARDSWRFDADRQVLIVEQSQHRSSHGLAITVD